MIPIIAGWLLLVQGSPDVGPKTLVEELERIGCAPSPDKNDPKGPIKTLVFYGKENVPAGDLKLLTAKSLAEVTTLSFVSTGVSDEAMTQVRKLTKLKYLILASTQVTGKGLEALADLPDLEILELGASRVDDEGMKHIGKLKKLRQLTVMNTSVGDKGLEHLQNATALSYLNLARTKVTDAGLSHLGKLERLKTLMLFKTAITDKGLTNLSKIKSVTDVVVGSGVTDEGIQAFRKARPDIQVDRLKDLK